MKNKPEKILLAAVCAIVTAGVVTAEMPREGEREGRLRKRMSEERMRGPMRGSLGNPLERGGFMLRVLKDAELLEEAGISTEQSSRLQEVLTANAEKEIDLQAEMRKASLKQAELLAESSSTKDAVMESVETIGALRTEIAKLAMERILAVRETLDEKQIRSLMEKTRERVMKRRTRRERDPEGERKRERPERKHDR